MKIGAMELIVIFVVALLVIGPDKLPAYAKKLGSALNAFRKASADVTQEIRESVVEPLEEAQKPLREAMEPLEELKSEVNKNFKGVEKDLRNIGKKPKEEKKEEAPAEEKKAPEPVGTETAPSEPEAETGAEETAQNDKEEVNGGEQA